MIKSRHVSTSDVDHRPNQAVPQKPSLTLGPLLPASPSIAVTAESERVLESRLLSGDDSSRASVAQ